MGDFSPGSAYELRMQFVDTQRSTTLNPVDFQIIPVSDITAPTLNLTQGPAPTLNPNLTVKRYNATDATVPLGFTSIHVKDGLAIPYKMLYGAAESASVSVTGTDIATTAASGGTFTFTSITASKFDTLKALVPCPAYVKRDGATPLAHLVILTDVAADGLTLTAGDGTTGNEFGTDPGVVAAGDTVTITVPRRFEPGVSEFFAVAEVADGRTNFETADGLALTTAGFSSSKGALAQWTFAFEGIATRGPAGATYGSGTETAAPTGVDFNPAKCTLLRFGVDGLMADLEIASPTHELYLNEFSADFTLGELPVAAQGFLPAYRHVRDRLTPTVSFTLAEHADQDSIITDFKNCVRNSLIYGLFMTEDDATVNGMGFWVPRGSITEATPGGRSEATLGTRAFGLGVEEKTYTVTTAPTSRDRYIMPFFFDNITL